MQRASPAHRPGPWSTGLLIDRCGTGSSERFAIRTARRIIVDRGLVIETATAEREVSKMGRIDVRDGDETTELAEVSGWSGRVSLDPDHPNGPRILVTSDAPFRSLVVRPNAESHPRSGDDPFDPLTVLLVPAVLAVLYIAAGLVVGFSAIDPRSTTTPAVSYALLAPLFGTAVVATRELHLDADRRRMINDDWQPNPWHYLFPGGIVLAVVGVFRVGSVEHVSSTVAAVLGILVVASLASSIVAGPAYVVRRHLAQRDR